MSTRRLARHYDALTPWERLPLIVAAALRGDDVEVDRLHFSAERREFRIPDHWGLLTGLDELRKLYVLRQLDLAATYWWVSDYLEEDPLSEEGEEDAELQDQWCDLSRILAYKFVVRAEGFRLLCGELSLDAEGLLRGLPGYDTLARMAQEARLLAFQPAEALDYLRERSRRNPGEGGCRRRDECRLPTAADVARSMRAFLQDRFERWS